MVATLRGLDERLFRKKAAAMLEGFTLYSAANCPSVLIPKACGSES